VNPAEITCSQGNTKLVTTQNSSLLHHGDLLSPVKGLDGFKVVLEELDADNHTDSESEEATTKILDPELLDFSKDVKMISPQSSVVTPMCISPSTSALADSNKLSAKASRRIHRKEER